jgi:hypothetical protein
MSVAYLPTCRLCGSSMRPVRVCERGQTRFRVFEYARCHAELMWAPDDNEQAFPSSRPLKKAADEAERI